MQTVGNPLLWTGFAVIVLVFLALDLGVHRKAHVVRFREALMWVGIWVALALAFNAWIYFQFGTTKALEFLTGYLVEEALSIDNVFVFIVVFSFFRVPAEYQHRVLFWGILGALIMRAIFIFVGAALISRFHWVLYIFGGILIITGIRMMTHKEEDIHPEKNIIYRAFRKFVPMVHGYHGQHFFVVENGRRLATPLLLVLFVIEGTDVVFAVDSIPAIFGITQDPFIIYTSNIFAILGLRSLFFVVARFMEKFHLLRYGLAVVLLFIGAKMLIAEYYKVPIVASLATVGGVLALSVILSIVFPPSEKEAKEIARIRTGEDPIPPELQELVEGDEPVAKRDT